MTTSSQSSTTTIVKSNQALVQVLLNRSATSSRLFNLAALSLHFSGTYPRLYSSASTHKIPSSARQPLLVSAGPSREPPLIRKLQSVQRDKPSPKSRLGLANIVEEREDDQRKKELESQKARIVAQMAPPPSTVASTSPAPIEVDDENVPPPPSHRRDVKAAEMTLVTQPCPPTQEGPRGFETFYQTLNAAFEARAEGYLFRNASTLSLISHWSSLTPF